MDLLIRELSRLDRPAVSFSFRRLGERSLGQRFLGPARELSPRELERLTTLDHWHHEALIAFSPVPRTPVGVAEYVRLDAFDEAEIAVVVVDEWQHRGVGAQLMEALRTRAMAAGVRSFTATTLRSNGGALALARRLGDARTLSRYRDTLELRIELSTSSPSHSPAAPATASRSLVKL